MRLFRTRDVKKKAKAEATFEIQRAFDNAAMLSTTTEEFDEQNVRARMWNLSKTGAQRNLGIGIVQTIGRPGSSQLFVGQKERTKLLLLLLAILESNGSMSLIRIQEKTVWPWPVAMSSCELGDLRHTKEKARFKG